MFKKLRKRWNCKHEFHYVDELRRWEGSEYVNYVVVYCPKCGKETYMFHSHFRREKAKKKIREDYVRRNGE